MDYSEGVWISRFRNVNILNHQVQNVSCSAIPALSLIAVVLTGGNVRELHICHSFQLCAQRSLALLLFFGWIGNSFITLQDLWKVYKDFTNQMF